MKIKIISLGKFAYGFLIFFLILISGLMVFSALNFPPGLKLYTIQSGSMEPAVHLGSLIVSKPINDYQEKDVITFTSEKNSKNTITHRLHQITTVDGQTKYITKGDANNVPESNPIEKEMILGKMIFSIPFLGFPVSFAKTKEGLIFLIIIPSVLIIYSELINIKNEVIKKITAKNEKNHH